MKRFVCLLILLLLMPTFGIAEESQVHVIPRLLNGRARPSKQSFREAIFDSGDTLFPTGKWSTDHNWIEVSGGESGTVWVHIKYVTERNEEFYVKNERYSQVKIRRHPINGRVSLKLRKGQRLKIDRVVMGWGHCSKGWVDLSYVDEVE